MAKHHEYMYQLIEFIGEKSFDGKKAIECVPSSWIKFDLGLRECYVHYPPLDTDEDVVTFHRMIVENQNCLLTWPKFKFGFVGEAEIGSLCSRSPDLCTGDSNSPSENQRVATKMNGNIHGQSLMRKKQPESINKETKGRAQNDRSSILHAVGLAPSQNMAIHRTKSIQAETSSVSENIPVVQKTGEKSGCIDQKIEKLSDQLTTLAYDVRQICTDIQAIKYEQSVLIATVNAMQKLLEQLSSTNGAIVQNSSQSFEMKFQLTFPVPSYEKFEEFDELLSTDETCRTAFVQQLCQKYDEKRSITKNLTAILRKYLTRDVAMKFNAQKKAENKILLKDTTFFECLTAMFDILVENKRIPPSTDKEYLLHLGTVLSNAKDWGMSRPCQATQNVSEKDLKWACKERDSKVNFSLAKRPIAVQGHLEPLIFDARGSTLTMALAGRLALVTGAGSGIGRAACKALAIEGAKVVAADLNAKNAKDTVSLLHGTDHIPLEIDVSELESVEKAFDKVIDVFAKPPTILVNSAGITRDNFLLKLSPIDFERVMSVNLTGTFYVTQTGVKKMIESNTSAGGSVVNIGSIAGKTGNIGQCNYSASKAGVEAFTKTASMEFGKFGVRVNAILPGIIDTEMTKRGTIPDKVKEMFMQKIPLGRFGKPEEVAELILFLASDKSSYINGASVEITGGFH